MRKLGVSGIELDAVGDFFPRALSETGRRELKHLLRSHDLELAALSCPMRHGLDVPEQQEARIEYLREALSMSFDLGSRVAVVQVGQIPKDEKDPRFTLLTEALRAVGQHGDRVGATLALETGLDDGATLVAYLDRFDTAGLAVCLNPGNLLVHGHDPYAAARTLNRRVVVAHAKDARIASASRGAQEVPLGQGDIDWLQFLATFEEIDYRGYLTIDHEPKANPLAESKASVDFLRRIVG